MIGPSPDALYSEAIALPLLLPTTIGGGLLIHKNDPNGTLSHQKMISMMRVGFRTVRNK